MAQLQIYWRFKVSFSIFFFFLHNIFLRPAPQSARRSVPEHIPRPDYALHPEGVSLSEKNARNGQILVRIF
jgi:hypothetical protein